MVLFATSPQKQAPLVSKLMLAILTCSPWRPIRWKKIWNASPMHCCAVPQICWDCWKIQLTNTNGSMEVGETVFKFVLILFDVGLHPSKCLIWIIDGWKTVSNPVSFYHRQLVGRLLCSQHMLGCNQSQWLLAGGQGGGGQKPFPSYHVIPLCPTECQWNIFLLRESFCVAFGWFIPARLSLQKPPCCGRTVLTWTSRKRHPQRTLSSTRLAMKQNE